jgi:hypothetical protein
VGWAQNMLLSLALEFFSSRFPAVANFAYQWPLGFGYQFLSHLPH